MKIFFANTVAGVIGCGVYIVLYTLLSLLGLWCADVLLGTSIYEFAHGLFGGIMLTLLKVFVVGRDGVE